MRSIPKDLLKGVIRLYAFAISPLTGPSCRFHPTCSAYAMEAIDRHGALKGLYLTLRRVIRCHPWYRGDYIDPVP